MTNHRTAPLPSIIDAMQRYEDRENQKDPGRQERIAEQQRLKRLANIAERDAVIAGYGSREAALAGTKAEQALQAAADKVTTQVMYKYGNGDFPTACIAGWMPQHYESKITVEARSVLSTALPLPRTLAEAKAEYDAWRRRSRELELLNMEDDGRWEFLADEYLSPAWQGRQHIIRLLLDGEMPATSIEDAVVRLRWIMDQDDAGEIMDVLLSDLERLASENQRLREALEPFARADRAIGEERGPFRFETGNGYRLIERDDLRRASAARGDAS